MGIVKFFLPRRSQIPRSLFTRVNFIVRMWNNPCDVPWVLYVETLEPAALEAFITLIDFGIADLARNIFRPAGLLLKRRGRHARGRRPKITRRLQRKIMPLRKLQDRKIGQKLKWMWIVDTKLQQVLWYFLIADVASEFLYRWTSGIYCTDKSDLISCPGAALGMTDEQTILGIFGWDALSVTTVMYERGGAGFSGPVLNMIDGMWLVSAGGTIVPTGPGTINVRARLTDPGHSFVADETELFPVSKEKPGDFVLGVMIENANNLVVETQSDPGGNYVVSGFAFSGMRRPPGGAAYCPK